MTLSTAHRRVLWRPRPAMVRARMPVPGQDEVPVQVRACRSA